MTGEKHVSTQPNQDPANEDIQADGQLIIDGIKQLFDDVTVRPGERDNETHIDFPPYPDEPDDGPSPAA